MTRRGIILAGGAGTRLYPATLAISKQLLPIFDKPMVYYPLTTLMMGGIKEILIISTPEDTPKYKQLFGNGHQWGINLEYAIQPSPDGLAQALIIAEDFLNKSPSTLILGDNLFFGTGLEKLLQKAVRQTKGATIFSHPVNNPKRYGVVTMDENGNATGIEEKPEHPKSNFVVTGIYFYDEEAPALARTLKPSARGELEITDLNCLYLEQKTLKVTHLGRGFTWLDTGTHNSLLQASKYVQTLQHYHGHKIGCPEEISWKKGWINSEQLLALAQALSKNEYGLYLKNLIHEGNRL